MKDYCKHLCTLPQTAGVRVREGCQARSVRIKYLVVMRAAIQGLVVVWVFKKMLCVLIDYL